eukprot:s1683_g7.t1
MTGFERATGRHYSGKLACFGETVLAFVRTSQKGLPQWRRGIWLSKSANNDCHIVASGSGLYVTRSIRRLPDAESFQLEPLGEITASPWEYGYASLGHRLVYSKRSSLPHAVGIGSELKLDDKDALAVRDYARAHPFEDADPQAISAEAGKLHETGTADDPADGGVEVQNPGGQASSSQASQVLPDSGDAMDSSLHHSGKHDTEHEDDGGSSKRLHGADDVSSFPHGDAVPQTPEALLDDTPTEAMMSPAKEAKHDEPGSVNLLGRILKLEHLDIEPNVDMSADDVDFMVEHELNLDENPYEAVDDMEAVEFSIHTARACS